MAWLSISTHAERPNVNMFNICKQEMLHCVHCIWQYQGTCSAGRQQKVKPNDGPADTDGHQHRYSKVEQAKHSSERDKNVLNNNVKSKMSKVRQRTGARPKVAGSDLGHHGKGLADVARLLPHVHIKNDHVDCVDHSVGAVVSNQQALAGWCAPELLHTSPGRVQDCFSQGLQAVSEAADCQGAVPTSLSTGS